MKKKKLIILFAGLAFIILVLGIILLAKNSALRANDIEIIDVSEDICADALEKIYEDDKYTYSLPCVKSDSVFVKLSDGRKMLVVNALDEELVTIDKLMAAGLQVVKIEK